MFSMSRQKLEYIYMISYNIQMAGFEFSSRLPSELHPFLDLPLLQHGHIPKSSEIPNPSNIPTSLLNLCLTFAQSYCQKNGCQDVAFTEFTPQTLQALGLKKISPRMMFYHHPDLDPDGCLVLNPHITEIEKYLRMPTLQTCHSVNYGKTPYFYAETAIKHIEGYFFDSQAKLQSKGVYSNKNFKDLSSHEKNHLDGHDPTDTPKRLIPCQYKGVWEKITRLYAQTPAQIIDYLKNVCDKILVFDKNALDNIRYLNPADIGTED